MRQRYSCISHGSNVKQCFVVLACNSVQIRYIHGALRSGYATMRNATIQKTTFFELGENIYVHTHTRTCTLSTYSLAA